MNKSNLKAILTSVRDMIMRNRVAYKDYLGEETVTETKVLLEGVLGDEEASLGIKDSGFTGFVAGESYDVTIDGVTQKFIAIERDIGGA